MNDGYAERFSGVGRLLGGGALERLQAAHVCVIGVGGVGSWTVEGLARSGVGALTLIDLDDVCVTNVNRQLPALDGQIGRPKVAVLADRVKLINPECRVTALMDFFTAATAEEMLGAVKFDCVVDAIDNTGNKALLIAECVKRGLPCVTVGGAGGKRDATQIRAGDLGESGGDDLLRLVRKTLRSEHGFAKGPGHRYGVRCVFSAERPVFPWEDGTCQAEPEPGSNLKLDCASGFGTAVWVTGAFGLAASQEAVGLLLAGKE
ncbi:MAG: tRNA threonylcarbamoyladenosine dehydratase [Opitutaceae bacterium]|jgi:tRNA A37 threonylcarbamoyladenosine dehydratase